MQNSHNRGEQTEMAGHEALNKVLICIVLLTFTLGCTTTQSVTATSPQALVDSVAVGDTIEITRKDGTSLDLNVTEVSIAGIQGGGIFVPYADIQKVSISRENWIGTGLLVVLGAGLLYVLEKNLDCGLFPLNGECVE
jgi:hypothetical protein